MSSPRSYSVTVGSAQDGEGAPRRNPKAVDGLVTQPEGCTTLYESFQRSVKRYGDAPCLGTRKKVREEKKTIGEGDEKREWTYFEFRPFEFQTFNEASQTISSFGSGLRHLGLNPVSGNSIPHVYGCITHFQELVRAKNWPFTRRPATSGVWPSRPVTLKTLRF